MSDNTDPKPPASEGAATPPRRHAYYGPAPYHGAPRYSGDASYGYGAPTAVAPYYGPGYGPPGYGYASGYGGYGSPGYGYGYGAGSGAEESDSLLGALTITRMLRVCGQRWMTIAVVAVLGSVGAFAVYRTMPSIYEGSSLFEMSLRPKKIITRMDNAGYDESMYGPTEEIFNTRISKLNSRDVKMAVIQRYRSENPSSLVPDEKLIETLASRWTDVALVRRTHLVRVTVRSTNPELSVALANAYAMAVDTYTQDQNREQAEKAKEFLKTTVEAQKRDLARRDQEILDFRNSYQIDTMEGERKKVEAAQLSLNADAVALETQINRAREVVKALEATQNDADKFTALPESAPHAEALVMAHQRLQTAVTERNVLLTLYTPSHPEVAAKEKLVEQLRLQFSDEAARVRDTSKANLDLLLGQLADNRKRCEETDKRASELEQKIVTAKMRLETLLRERDVAETNFRDTLNRERAATVAIDDNAATITVVEKSQMPDERSKTHPVSPNPFVVLPAGPAIGILVGILFVLLLDHLEDKITDIGDIENRVRLKVLSVLPHIRRAKREQVAMLSAEDRFSHFAEAFAGLRNLLDSPRYSGVSKVMLVVSTQPGEGKTITASNFALSCALTGQRTLLIDFDLRRPRLATIYKKNRKEFESLFHVLSANDPSIYNRLPVSSGYANLDLVCTRASSKMSPSNLLGSGAVASFIDWARQNYDRVVIDSPPFGLVSDAVVLSTLADGVLVMCCPDRTRFRPLKHAVRHLFETGGHIIGVLVNDVDFGRVGMFGRYEYNYHYAYRYKYGGKYGYGARPGQAAPPVSPSAAEEEDVGQTESPRPAPASQAGIDDDDE